MKARVPILKSMILNLEGKSTVNKRIPAILLRDVIDSDLPQFFAFQLDTDASYMVAFTAEDPTDKGVFDVHWARIRNEKSILIQTILFEDKIVGYIMKFEDFGKAEIGYWIDRAYWGKGIATSALSIFIASLSERPLFAHVVKDNAGSLRVLEKCGFKIMGTDKAYAYARHVEVEEYILKLE